MVWSSEAERKGVCAHNRTLTLFLSRHTHTRTHTSLRTQWVHRRDGARIDELGGRDEGHRHLQEVVRAQILLERVHEQQQELCVCV
jgi:hypothetical protein